MLGNISLNTLMCSYLVMSKVNKIPITPVSLVYIFGPDHLDAIVVFQSVL